ncbi:hypothetical protein E2320_000070, partial [Naja naja]
VPQNTPLRLVGPGALVQERGAAPRGGCLSFPICAKGTGSPLPHPSPGKGAGGDLKTDSIHIPLGSQSRAQQGQDWQPNPTHVAHPSWGLQAHCLGLASSHHQPPTLRSGSASSC